MKLNEALAVAKALADETRMRLLLACEPGELCVCQLIELVGLAPSTVSKHLSVLKQAGLLESRKDGRWMHYRVASEGASEAVHGALGWVRRCVSDGVIASDRARLAEILDMEPEVLCQKQRDSACCSSAPATPAAARWPRAGRERSGAT